MKPHFETHANPLYQGGEGFTHYEIQTAREYKSPDGARFIEVVVSAKDAKKQRNAGPVFFGIYGRFNVGGVEHICDRRTLVDARETLQYMGVIK